MRIAKAIFAISVFVGVALTSTGIVEFFSARQTAMSMVALITVSRCGVCFLESLGC